MGVDKWKQTNTFVLTVRHRPYRGDLVSLSFLLRQLLGRPLEAWTIGGRSVPDDIGVFY